MQRFFAVIVSLCCFYFSQAQKKPLDHTVYDNWQHIGERLISNDGKWVVFTIDPQEGDNELVIRSSDAVYKKTVPRGYNAVITEDSRYLIFKIKPFFKDTREAKIKKKKADDFPKDSLAIIELGKEEIWKKGMVKNYKTAQRSFGWVAFQLEKQQEIPKVKTPDTKTTSRQTDSLNRVIDSLQKLIESTPQKKKKKRDDDELNEAPGANDSELYNFGVQTPDSELLTPNSTKDAEGDETSTTPAEPANDLVVKELSTGKETVFTKVLEYYFSKTGDKLLFEQAKDPADSLSMRRVILYDLKTGQPVTLSNGGNDFKNFAMTDDGSKVAYVADREAKPKDLVRFYKLWFYKEGMDTAEKIVDKNAIGMKLGMTVSEFGSISFSKSGRRLFFGSAPVPVPRDTTLIEMDMPKLDIWHYNDDYLQTVQNFPARLRAAQQENYLTLYDLETKKIRQIGSREIPQVLATNEGDGETFVGVTDFGKRVESQWLGATRKDIYAIDVNTGTKMMVKENLHGQVYPSSTGKYIMWYDRKAREYFVWDGSEVKNISEKIRPAMWNEEFDSPDDPNNYGVMGWHEGDSAVYVYDRFDIWAIPLTGGLTARNITANGRSTKTSYRYLRLNEEERYITSAQDAYFSFFSQETKQAGLLMGHVRDRVTPMQTITGGEFSYGLIRSASNSGNLIYTKENYSMAPDIYLKKISPLSPGNNPVSVTPDIEIRLSAINRQQSNYLWGTAELFRWKAYNGKDATGIVYKPENFDPKKKYPVIVYFYEKLSQGLFDYKEPAPIRSAVNVPYFVSNGYIVFMPDIEYKVGYPGQSAYDYIVSGARALVKKGWADSTRMALQGHSWGGYQAAQVATMTKLFSAVWAGAPVANMTSAYGGIRWESGVNRQFQYEKAQSRIGATLWERPELYIKNSPLFHLEKVTAPIVIMHNDADGAVPWYQGIELFTGLRRLGKKVWMLNYNGQGHGLSQRQDMKDYHVRMQQFFDYMLKGAKPTRWITEGVPAIKKGKDWGLEID